MTVLFALCDSKLSDKIKLVDRAHEWKGLFRKEKSQTVLKILRDFEGQLEPWNRANAAARFESIEWKSIVYSLNGAGEDREMPRTSHKPKA